MRATVECRGRRAVGEIVLRPGWLGSCQAPTHAVLANARAILAAATQLLADGDLEGARACAEQGITMLGKQYRDTASIDETESTLIEARLQTRHGDVRGGTAALVYVLETRTLMYLSKFSRELVH